MYKVQIADLLVFCDTPEEVIALAEKRAAGGCIYDTPRRDITPANGITKTNDKYRLFITAVSKLNTTAVSSGTLAQALGTSPNGVGPVISSLFKKHSELRNVITRVGPPGQSGHWVVNREALDKLDFTEKSA